MLSPIFAIITHFGEVELKQSKGAHKPNKDVGLCAFSIGILILKGVHMSIKNIALTILVVSIMIFTVACCPASVTENSILYSSDNVIVTLADNSGETNNCYYQWIELTDETVFEKNTVIVTGVVSNIREATVEYEFMDTHVCDDITIFDVEVADVLSCRSDSLEISDMITVGTGYTSSSYGEGLPLIEEGKTYMIFCYVAADREDDPLELAGYIDCWISAPKDLLIEKIGDSYLAVDYFKDKINVQSLADCIELTDNQINSLAAINKYDKGSVENYIRDNIKVKDPSYDPNVCEALLILKSRTVNGSTEFMSLIERTALINCSDLESYVKSSASTLGK